MTSCWAKSRTTYPTKNGCATPFILRKLKDKELLKNRPPTPMIHLSYANNYEKNEI